mmetsp:Transcript_82930/g.243159  ORF Transcript_82930/g.243159 Transcript_82930/m.243159 type:complete len:214 (+) Transcript_82930:882-1523(+)
MRLAQHQCVLELLYDSRGAADLLHSVTNSSFCTPRHLPPAHAQRLRVIAGLVGLEGPSCHCVPSLGGPDGDLPHTTALRALRRDELAQLPSTRLPFVDAQLNGHAQACCQAARMEHTRALYVPLHGVAQRSQQEDPLPPRELQEVQAVGLRGVLHGVHVWLDLQQEPTESADGVRHALSLEVRVPHDRVPQETPEGQDPDIHVGSHDNHLDEP